MWFATYLYEQGIVSGDDFARAVSRQLSLRPLLGQVAIREKKLTVDQVKDLFMTQAQDQSKSFGELATEKGYLNREELDDLLKKQSESVKSVCDILVDMGVLTESQITVEMKRMRQRMTDSDRVCVSTW